MTQPPENAELAVKANPMQDNPIQLLREASERANPRIGKSAKALALMLRKGADHRFANESDYDADAEFITLAVNYVRSILNSPDEAAVERAAACIYGHCYLRTVSGAEGLRVLATGDGAEDVARIVDPAAWADYDFWASRLRGEGQWPDNAEQCDAMRQSYARRMPERVAPSLKKAAEIAALTSTAVVPGMVMVPRSVFDQAFALLGGVDDAGDVRDAMIAAESAVPTPEGE